MTLGPGKYDDITTVVRKRTRAEAVIVIVINGNRGSGFSVQAGWPIDDTLPHLLRSIANQIEADH